MTRTEELNSLTLAELENRFVAMIEKEKSRELTGFNASFLDKAYFGHEELDDECRRKRLVGILSMHESYLAGEFERISITKPRNKNDKL